MTSETEAINQLISRLIALGYSEADIQTEVLTDYGRGIDLVVYESSKPKIVFEVKPTSNISSTMDSEQFKYNATVRQAQALANDLGSPYFSVYDGKTIFWFGVDEDGRPKLLPNPIIAHSTGESTDQRLRLTNALYKLNDIGIIEFHLDDLLLHVGVSLLAWVLNKKGLPALKEQLLSATPNFKLVDDHIDESEVFGHGFSREFYSKALAMLEPIHLPSTQGREFVKVLDDYLDFTFLNKKTGIIRLPGWISEFLARLGLIEDSDLVLDLYSTFDDIAIASYDISRDAISYSVVANLLFYVWAKTKRLLLDANPGGVYRESPLFRMEYLSGLRIEKPSVVFVAPPFGRWIPSKNNRDGKRSEDTYLEDAVEIVRLDGRIVAIMPEGFLTSKTYQATRKSIMETANLQAIFSLDQFMPGTSIKASVLVLEKSFPRRDHKVIFARIQQSDIATSEERARSIQKGSRLEKIIDFYKKYRQGHLTTTRLRDVYQIQSTAMTPSSWAFTNYAIENVAYQASDYPLVRLRDIAKLSKGSTLKLSKGSGNLPVIGPAAVRAFAIDQSKFDLTEKDLLTSTPVLSRAGDILINAIGPYRGHTALVDQHVEGIHISRNIIVVRPSRDKVLPEFLLLALNSKFVQQQLEELATGSVILQLSIGKIENLFLPLPDIETQKLLVGKVQTIQQKIASAEQRSQELHLEMLELRKELQALVDNFQSGGERNE